jgi:hypothetical protein
VRVGPDEMPEPPQRAGAPGVRRPGPRPAAVPMGMTRLGTMIRVMGRTGPPSRTVLVSVATGAGPGRLRISHGIQDARNIRLQHLDNSQPRATAKDPQARRAS